MKQIFTHVLIFSIALVFSCRDKSTNPPDDYPPGYQHDIPWPSLADSPWPMNHGNPQSTGRSKYLGPQLGLFERTFETPEIEGGIAIGADTTIYITSSDFHVNSGLYAISFDGILKWKFKSPTASYTTPLIGKDGTIYFACITNIFAVNPDGTKKWEYVLNEGEYANDHGMNIGLDGTIYFLSGGKLTALNLDGSLKWKLINNKLRSQPYNLLVFSPDGNTLYTLGVDDALLAISIDERKIKWTFGRMNNFQAPPIVDSDGNIYVAAIVDTIDSGKVAFYSVNPNGKIRWYYSSIGNLSYQPTIDKNGNIYFANSTLYSFSYDGKLRWKYSLDGYSGTSLVCDKEGTIYVGVDDINLNIIAFSSDGTIKWNVKQSVYGALGLCSAIGYNKLFIPTSNWYNFYSIK